jgi:hypothetical protein
MARTWKPRTRTNRDALNELFAALRRKHSLLARQNFLCCSGCAGSALWSQLEERPRASGAVYYHQQDGSRLREGAESVYLNYGAREGGTDAEIARQIVAEARLAGLEAEWNGDANVCVIVRLPGGIDARFRDPIPEGAAPIFPNAAWLASGSAEVA